MPDPIAAPTYGFPLLIPEALSSTQELQNWMAEVSDALNQVLPLSGVGSPEGVLAANVGRFYVDTDSKDLYYKEIGTGESGWELTT